MNPNLLTPFVLRYGRGEGTNQLHQISEYYHEPRYFSDNTANTVSTPGLSPWFDGVHNSYPTPASNMSDGSQTPIENLTPDEANRIIHSHRKVRYGKQPLLPP